MVAGHAFATTKRPPLGLASYCMNLRRKYEKQRKSGVDFGDPLTLLEHVRKLGGGGIQAPLRFKTKDGPARLRSAVEGHGMYVEAIVAPFLRVSAR